MRRPSRALQQNAVFRRRHQIPLGQRLRRWLWPHIGWRRMGTYVVKRVTRLSGTPHSIAAGAACGVAISFTPFMGFHLVGAFLLCLGGPGQLPGGRRRHTGRQSLDPAVHLARELPARACAAGRSCRADRIVPELDPRVLLRQAGGGLLAHGCRQPSPRPGRGPGYYFALVRIVTAYQEARARRRQTRRALKAHPASPDAGVP